MLGTVTPACDPGDLWPEMQVALSALAEVEERFETACALLNAWNGHERMKRRFADQAEARRAHDREPLVQQIAELYQTYMNASLYSQADGVAAPPS